MEKGRRGGYIRWMTTLGEVVVDGEGGHYLGIAIKAAVIIAARVSGGRTTSHEEGGNQSQ